MSEHRWEERKADGGERGQHRREETYYSGLREDQVVAGLSAQAWFRSQAKIIGKACGSWPSGGLRTEIQLHLRHRKSPFGSCC